MDLDLRKLRYFVAVAEHRHFGRAAEQLYIAQPVLSRQIRAFERELGCALLTRTTRSVELTAAGERLHEEARRVLATVDGAVRRVHEADRGVARLAVAFAPGLHVSEAVRAFTAVHPGVEIDLVPLRWYDQHTPLRDGRAHVGFLRRPFDDTGLRTIPVGLESRAAILPAAHPLAARPSLTSVDLEGEKLLNAQQRRAASLEEKFELIAAGYGIGLGPLSVARAYHRPDLVPVPVTDAEPYETCLAAPEDSRDERLLDFLEIATKVLRG
ncbi:DNA-binding transcriptional LysR family regulator [Streptomyces sp. B3I7]|uniref:LysR family transcriptional regulator n=1 Tax=Streptomyces sp. B3I7 TaxID=3042269 RepID=UPI00278B9FDB|nr:LysR family transcriptional regulator [Streptomyces sp. B3I7]MDQ0811413.1 DNA-binding transcriptional LysR family regulator [Streptomyces sp. B3I7]